MADEDDVISNRVDPGVQNRLAHIALDGLDGELDKLEQMFKTPIEEKSGIESAKTNTFRANQLKSQMYLVKLMAQFASGAVHPTRSNTHAEKTAANAFVADAKKALDEKIAKWAAKE